ncbi:MAG: carbon-nitrogen hydrolase family protein [Planctomycetes bacterium]|nr:carbon-nitrogen hydrolase family protein [Planctomycetota bacterium]
MPMLYKIAGVQMDVELGNRERNCERMIAALRDSCRAGNMLTVFPECALTGYCFDSLEEARQYAEPIPGPSTQRICAAAWECGGHIAFGMLEREGDRVFNACVLAGPAGVVASYRKVHLPYLGVDRFTTPGDRPFAVHEISGLRVGMTICYDAAFPEAARCLALEGADLIILPTNWPPGAQCTAACVINTRALENAVYYMAVDRVGEERGFRFIGKSRICNTSGETIAIADHADPAIIQAEIDVEKARNKRIVRVPGLHVIDRFNDRRPEFYQPVTAPKPPR